MKLNFNKKRKFILIVVFMFYVFPFSQNMMASEIRKIYSTSNKVIKLIMYMYAEGEVIKAKSLSEKLLIDYVGKDVVLVKMVLLAVYFDDEDYIKAINIHSNIKYEVGKVCDNKKNILDGWSSSDVEYYCYVYYSRLGVASYKVANYKDSIDILESNFSLITKYTNNPYVYYDVLFFSYLRIKDYKSAKKYIELLFNLANKKESEISKNKLYYNYACLESLRGNNKQAFELLKKIKDKKLLLLVKEDDDLLGFRASKYYGFK